jgi:hypothetical protein
LTVCSENTRVRTLQDPAIREAKDTLDLWSADPAVQDLVQRRKHAWTSIRSTLFDTLTHERRWPVR